MDENTVLYQLMDIRINEALGKITANDDEYQATVKESDSYAGKLDALELSEETRHLIDQYISANNASPQKGKRRWQEKSRRYSSSTATTDGFP